MVKAKLDAAIVRAERKLLDKVGDRPTRKAAGAPGAFLMTIVKSMVLPALGPILSELLKSANARTKKYLIIARDVLVDAQLDAE